MVPSPVIAVNLPRTYEKLQFSPLLGIKIQIDIQTHGHPITFIYGIDKVSYFIQKKSLLEDFVCNNLFIQTKILKT